MFYHPGQDPMKQRPDYRDHKSKKERKKDCHCQCKCIDKEDLCKCTPKRKAGDEYLSGFHFNGNLYQFDNIDTPIPTVESEFARISNIPLNCGEKIVWLNITAGVINRDTADNHFVFYRVYRNSVAPENLIASVSDNYGQAGGEDNDNLDVTHFQALDLTPGPVGSTVTYIITYQADAGSGTNVRLNGPRVATANVVGECR